MIKDKEILRQECDEIIHALNSLKDDDGVPKNVKIKIEIIISDLKEDTDVSTKVSKSLHNLDEVSEDLNLPSFIRTQIYTISSMLEKLNSQ
jgi:uncharacterized protein (UPF0147 family)